jgi:hypothetical protein
MAQRPSIQGLKLEPCCKKSLKEIDDKIKMGKLLKRVLAVSPFVTMLGSKSYEVAFSVATTDWDMLIKATQSVAPIVKHSCRTIAELEMLDHPGGPLNRFWEAMAESFE